MKFSIVAISDPTKISDIHEELDAFIIKNCKNPFVLSVFIKKEMESTIRKNFIPIVLVFKYEEKIIGVAPLLLKKKFKMILASFLFHHSFSPDFIFDTEYKEVCVQNFLHFLFNNLKCHLANFCLPADSLNMRVLEGLCDNEKISYIREVKPYLNHCVIPVDRTWEDFQKSKGANFRHHFRQIQLKLNRFGPWKIVLFENANDERDVLQRIMDIEKSSWKQNWRFQQRISKDEYLLQLWEASSLAIRTCPDYKRSVWFLEINNQAIAYSLIIQYKGIAYIAKTSYNNQFRKLYPSVYTINQAISELFNSKTVIMIDFLTDLPFMKRWTSKYQMRTQLLLWNGFLLNLVAFFIQRPKIKDFLKLLPKTLINIFE
jgi:hypothetical protein